MRAMLVVSTSVLVLLAAPILSEVLIEDQFTSFTGWNYSRENCSGFSVTCDGNYISPASYGICGESQWEGIEKILPTPITANQDFEVSFRPFVASDPSGQMGGVFLFCMNDFGEIVAQLTWFEPQFSSGFGGVTFWAEGSLIYGDLSGFDSEYPTIDATLKLSRSGDQWSASVDDTQKGTTLSLSPSKDITRVLVAFYNFSDYQERDIKVDFIRLETTGSGWCDDFEDYETGSHPSTWHGTGNFGATMVDNTISYSGNNSLKFFGAIGSCWAGLATRPINVSCPFTIELAIRNGTEDLYGCHPERGSVEFKMGPNWPDPGVPGGFLFMENGDLKISLPDGQHIFSGFALNEWHKVRACFDTPGDGLWHAKYWVDCQYLGEYTGMIGPEGYDPQYIMIGAQEGTAWFDDVCVKPGTEYAFVGFDIKPGSCPNPLNVGAHGQDFILWGEWNETTDAGATQTTFAKPSPEHQSQWKAVLPAAILGTADFDVTMIDPATICILNDLAPIRWSYEDVATPIDADAEECVCNELGPDGYMDLTVKFDRGNVITALGEVSDGEMIPMTVTGCLTDGTPFEGSDCVFIIANDQPAMDASSNTEGDFDLCNHPNPFNPSTTISFRLDRPTYVRLDIFNITGQKVRTLANGQYQPGEHSIIWYGTDLQGRRVSSGVYFYRLNAGDISETKQMVLLK